MCHVIPAVFGVVVCASTMTLTVIAADRFALIVVGISRRMSSSTALILVSLIAFVSALISIPAAIFSRIDVAFFPDFNIDRRYCVEVWPAGYRHIRHLYTVGTLVVQYFLPLLVIAVLYLLIFRHVRASRKQTGRQRVVSNTNRMLVAVVAVFAVAWTPFQVFSMVSELRPALVHGPYFKFTDVILRVIAMASSVLNPILYGWMNSNFKRAFLGFLGRGSAVPGSRSVVMGGRGRRRIGSPATCGIDQNYSVVCLQQIEPESNHNDDVREL